MNEKRLIQLFMIIVALGSCNLLFAGKTATQFDQDLIMPDDDLALPTLAQADTPPAMTEKDSLAVAQGFAPSTAKKKNPKPKEKKDIYLNFENTSLSNFINYMADMKKLNVIPEKGIEEAKISLTIRDPLTVEGAWNVFLTVLEMAGFAMVKVGDVHKVVTKDKKLTEPLPSFINVAPEELPNSDLEIRYVMFLQNIQVGDVRDLLQSMLSQPSTIVDHADANAFIITDKSYNIKAAAKLIFELDQIGLQETVTVLRLKKANAIDVAELLKTLIKEPEGNPLARLLGKQAEGSKKYFSSSTKIIPEERTNSLIMMGPNKSIDKIVDFITKHIDTDLQAAESPLHIYELKYTDASQIKDILEVVTQAPESSVGQHAGKYGAIRGGVKYFKSMNFEVDKDGNRLIISSTDKYDWKLLKRTIKDLDKPQPQVGIETLIVSVNSTDMKGLGGMIRNKKHGALGRHIDFQSASLTGAPSLEMKDGEPISLLGNLLEQLIGAKGATLLSFGKGENIWSVFRMLREYTNATLLSQPFITVTNKTEANIQVGEERQVLAEEGDGKRGFERIDVNTSIKVKPQINLDGLIRMDVSASLQDFGDAAGNIRTNKSVDTNVTVANGQILVLGGFVKTKVTESKSKTPILGDIPILGWLFKKQQRTITKDYIFIFMSPTIIKPRQRPGTQLYTKMKMHEATDSIEESIVTTNINDPVHNWFFNPKKENYSHKVIDFANARYQPTTVDIENDPFYRSQTRRAAEELEAQEKRARKHKKNKIKEHTLQRDAVPERYLEHDIEQTNFENASFVRKPGFESDQKRKQPIQNPVIKKRPQLKKKEPQKIKAQKIKPEESSKTKKKQTIKKVKKVKKKKPELQKQDSPKPQKKPEPTGGEPYRAPTQKILHAQKAAPVEKPTMVAPQPAEESFAVRPPIISDKTLNEKRKRLKALLGTAPQKETIETDDENIDDLERKRRKLKAMLAGMSQTPEPAQETIQQKRKNLKAMFGDPTPSEPVKKAFTVDPDKRNKLKEFLAQNAQAEKKKTQKGSA